MRKEYILLNGVETLVDSSLLEDKLDSEGCVVSKYPRDCYLPANDEGKYLYNCAMVVSEYKELQKDALEVRCHEEITSTFLSSSAHTAGYRYDCTRDAQSNAIGAYVAAVATGRPQWIYTHDGTEFRQIDHTEAQAMVVVSDMRQHVANKQVTLSLAKNAINALSKTTSTCADVDAIVNAIVW